MKNLFVVLLCCLMSAGCLDVLKGKDGEDGKPGSGFVETLYHVVESDEIESDGAYYEITIRDSFFEMGCNYSLWYVTPSGKGEMKLETVNNGTLFFVLLVADDYCSFDLPIDYEGETLLFIKTKPTSG